MGTKPVLEEGDNAGTGDGGGNGEICRRPDADQQRSFGFDANDFALPFKLPRSHHRAGRKTTAKASVVDKLARMIGPAVAIQVIWRGSGCKALNARTDWNRHHVLLQTLVVSDASITTSGQNVDKVILRNHFQPDVRISGEKGRRDGGQHEACRTDRYVQTQGTCWPVAGAVDDVDGSFHLGECWPEPLEETLTCLSGRHGSRRPVQQSDAELRFQPGYRFAES
ncbi:hypothetical protein XI04_04755 [Bradyrhizobium sp. CCBAU 11430]|nr:hypothetical protein [Bradyrhizobium sp. CCBAU 21359]MDA9512371.1 hypothetical protein [Bradyrhizobium sp. CCBAU 11430]